METLSVRENEIARLVALGYSNKRIGDRLKISEQTVKNHLQSIFRKVAVTNRVELTIRVTTAERRAASRSASPRLIRSPHRVLRAD